MNTLDTQIKLGVLGGGQLGQMLIRSAVDFGLKLSVLDPGSECPSCPYTHAVQGDFNDYNDVLNFGRDKDLLTIEIENVNVDALTELQKAGVRIAPSPEIIALIQDKGDQKKFYQKQGFPVADAVFLEAGEVADVPEDFLPGILKSRRAGYDGQGVMSVEDREELKQKIQSPSLLEKKISIEKEISIIAVRNASGEVRFYPPVEMVFHEERHILEMLVSPADVEQKYIKEGNEILNSMLEALNYQGLLAMEFFISTSGKLYVNEAAPRPHNSGHQTIEGNGVSQYEQHLRAIMGLPLGETSLLFPTAMINLLGSADTANGLPVYEGIEEVLATPGAAVHLYGKSEVRPFRKMGHITVRGNSRAEVIEKARHITAIMKVRGEGNG